jgi:hypothetical protein
MTFAAGGSQGPPAFQLKAKRQIMKASPVRSLACNFRRTLSAHARKT